MSVITEERPKTYSDKLKDPRWQKRRLEVFVRDGWRCRCCGEDSEPLEVHHLAYRYSAEPWEYDLEDLITFCHRCHKFEHQLQTLKKAGIDPAEMEKKIKKARGI